MHVNVVSSCIHADSFLRVQIEIISLMNMYIDQNNVLQQEVNKETISKMRSDELLAVLRVSRPFLLAPGRREGHANATKT